MARILVADGQPDSADSLALMLRGWGHRVRAATSAADALRLALSFLPEAALIDLDLPEAGGREVARGLRAVAGLEKAQLVAMTAPQPGAGRRAPDRDFDLFLPRPVDPDELKRALAALAPRAGA
jgi:CheY-like chemotaxis protein